MLSPLPVLEKQYQPQRLAMSYQEYLEFASDSQKVEWVNGEAIIYMPATPPHQRLVVFLVNLLQQFTQIFNLGIVQVAPVEVKLWPGGPSREPDILFIAHVSQAQETAKRIEGAPDLVVEIISPGSVTIDRRDKYREYEQAGVKEYWLIDPRPRQPKITIYVLDPEGFFIPTLPDEKGHYCSSVLPHFWFKMDWLQQFPLTELALAEIMLTIADLPPADKAFYQSTYQFYAQKVKKL